MISPTDVWTFLLVFCSIVSALIGWSLGRRYTSWEVDAMTITEEDIRRLVRAFENGPCGEAVHELAREAEREQANMGDAEAFGLN